jgi:hypothetical protein
MSKKNESTENNTNTNTTSAHSEYAYNTNNNNRGINSNDFNKSINKLLDETKDNIQRSIDESRNQIPRYNNIVNNYQEQSLQAAKEISEDYIESQKSVKNSLQSAWKPYNESYNGFINIFVSPDTVVKTYTRFVSNFADNAVSAIRLTNNIIFSNMDSWKSVLQQAKDNSRHFLNLNVNIAKTFAQNSKEIAAAVVDSNPTAAAANGNVFVTSTTNSNTQTK